MRKLKELKTEGEGLEERGGHAEGGHYDGFGIEAEDDDAESAQRDGEGEGGGDGDAAGVVGGLDVHALCDEEVVEEGDDGEDGTEEHEPVEAALGGGPEDVQRGPEAGHERNAAEGEQEEQHRQRQQW